MKFKIGIVVKYEKKYFYVPLKHYILTYFLLIYNSIDANFIL